MKKVKAEVKIQLKAGKANPSPPVGTALGPHGVNIMGFCKLFNEQTKDQGDLTVPVVITIYEDRTFEFVLKSPPAAVLLLKALGLPKGSASSLNDKIGKVTKSQIDEIARIKQEDLNANSIEAASKIILGTARSMGIELENEIVS